MTYVFNARDAAPTLARRTSEGPWIANQFMPSLARRVSLPVILGLSWMLGVCPSANAQDEDDDLPQNGV